MSKNIETTNEPVLKIEDDKTKEIINQENIIPSTIQDKEAEKSVAILENLRKTELKNNKEKEEVTKNENEMSKTQKKEETENSENILKKEVENLEIKNNDDEKDLSVNVQSDLSNIAVKSVSIIYPSKKESKKIIGEICETVDNTKTKNILKEEIKNDEKDSATILTKNSKKKTNSKIIKSEVKKKNTSKNGLLKRSKKSNIKPLNQLPVKTSRKIDSKLK